MPVGLVRKWLTVGILAAAIGTVACSKEDDPDPTDGGGTPGGGTPGGSGDGGSGDGGGGTPGGSGDGGGGTPGGNGDGGGGTPGGGDGGAGVVCGGETCTGHMTLAGLSAPGCATNVAAEEVCGIDTVVLGGVDAGLPPFLEKNAPGVASASCAAYIDEKEPASDAGVMGNGLIDTTRMIGTTTVSLSYPGCCTANGRCSGQTDEGLLAGSTPSSAGYGCMNPLIFLASQPFFAAEPTTRVIPCDPVTGEVTAAGDAGTGDAGVDAGDDAGEGDGGE